ncbi:type IV secretion system protein [Sphingomonas sp. R-74633]|uniref:type IV secretion system protein n=1 Tax=Sphingomonas sp. R-74633 TaxID=2751188 RepID=UPI0015D369E4|nr:type IV secretion system protein [Sphingomonas sp. R-74633]NYT40677.1 type IV secretion system protein [Sphingomonas sp. R-74633]
MSCPGIVESAYLQSVLGFVDCQARTIGAASYQAAVPGSSFSLLSTGLLTLSVAFFGYRLVFGDTPNVREGVLAVAKIGIVLALVTSWSAYRTLAYDVAMHAPAELVASAGAGADMPGTTGDLVERLQQVDDALIALNALRPPAAKGQPAAATRTPAEPISVIDPFALGTARVTFLVATIAAYASVRLVTGLLLALGPFFILLLLFEGSRSLFEGWIRALVAAALGAVAVTILLGAELALLEPWLTDLLSRRVTGPSADAAMTELFVTAFAFGLTMLGGLGMAARVAMGFRMGVVWRGMTERIVASAAGAERFVQSTSERSHQPPAAHQSRAEAVAEAVSRTQRREAAPAASAGNPTARLPDATNLRGITPGKATPLGQTSRRTRTRVSANATRRDSGT